ncbi:Hypothetical protein ADU71_2078 [Pediococcus damnosus]|nr:Hypothetical protein ADU71_2078 [Pediococcus damnosus]
MFILHPQNLIFTTDDHPYYIAKAISRTGSCSSLMFILHPQNLIFTTDDHPTYILKPILPL